MKTKNNTQLSLKIRHLSVSVGDRKIVKDVSLTVRTGEIHAIMGPNGSGKSTLALSVMGHPKYEITNGSILIGKRDITHLSPEKRAQLGLFLAFQYPVSIPGVSVANFLRVAYNNIKNKKKKPSVAAFQQKLKKKMQEFAIPEEFATRYVNDGFSGGEKKKTEILQLAMLEPSFAILDETDSGLDIDALKIVAKGVNRSANDMGILVITHYQRLLHFIKPDKVHVLIGGSIVASGGGKLAEELEAHGYDWLKTKTKEKR